MPSSTKPPFGIGHNSQAAEPRTVVDRLHEALRKVVSDFNELKEPTPANKLGARHLSLGVAIELIHAVFPDGDHLTSHLDALLVELQDLHDGHAADTLVPVATGHRPKGIRSEAGMHRAGYAAQVEMLRRQGRPLDQAVGLVLNTIPANSVAWVGLNKKNGRAIKRWRDDCARHAPSSEMKLHYERLIQLYVDGNLKLPRLFRISGLP